MNPELLQKILSDITPGAVGIWTGVLMFAGYLMREYRETKKLSAEDRQARREGYAAQVSALTAENREQRKEMQAMRAEHTEYRRLCELETDSLRKQILGLMAELAGTKRRLDTQAGELYSIATGELPPATSPTPRFVPNPEKTNDGDPEPGSS